MTSQAQARELALGLPEAAEQDHHGMASYRVRGRIFATVPDEEHLRIMASDGEILAAVAEDPVACCEFWWGARLACVVVELERVEPALVRELLIDAWRRRAPGRLVADFDAAAGDPGPAT